MKSDNLRELTLEEMIELGYSSEEIHKCLDNKIKASQKNKQDELIAKARAEAVAALKAYMIALGFPAEELKDTTLEESFEDFEKHTRPILKTLAKLPQKKDERIDIDDSAFESALATLRRFADSL